MKKREKISYDSVSELDGSLDALISRLQKKASEFKKQGWEEVTVEIETCYGYYDDTWIEVSYYGVKTITVKEFIEGDEVAIHAGHLKKKK